MTGRSSVVWRSTFAMAAATAILVMPGGAIADAAGHASGGSVAGQRLHSASINKAAALPANVSVVAAGLNQPRKITVGPNGNLYVTEAGLNSPPTGCVTGAEAACANPSGAVAEITPSGAVKTVVSGLPSVNGGTENGPGASGPSGITIVNGKIQFLIQNTDIDATTGAESFGPNGALLGDLLSSPLAGATASKVSVEAELGPYEAKNNPDKGAGTGGEEPPIDSDPYGVTPYDGGLAIADAAANDVLLYKNGTLSTLAVLPLVQESGGPGQAVPTSLAVGPDGDLYIGELGGAGGGNDVGVCSVYKLAAGKLIKVVGGLTMVGDIGFDQAGRLLVLEMDQMGLLDPSPGLPAPGALIRINANGSKTTLASTGLEYPGGLAVAKDGSIYVTNWSVLQGTDDPNLPPGLTVGGDVVQVSDNVPADQIGANLGGYREIAKDGGVFTFGHFGFYGSEGGTALVKPVVGAAQTPTGPGYWEVASDGGVFTFGTAGFYGSTGGVDLVKPIVGMAAMPDGKGYFLFASDGGVFTFGDAQFHGSLGGVALNAPIIGGAVTPDGGGYWLFASDGGVFTFGDAKFFGSLGGTKLVKPVVSGAATPNGAGYYLFAADGGVFTFGNAKFHGSLGGVDLVQPVVNGMVTPDNGGYAMVASDGGVFAFGNAAYYGSEGGVKLNQPVVSFG